ncbi:hypothetical protein PoB_005553300 [Plakobranchus ocellatus]|uniref:Uncharacterized protein n=1 Tax=Plakobranchus ocellatus TaxID=259542 RepID=A0AAV4CC39_9GAST|nr:hypothetical protein PoB_005553300 [Plakobranchus ocellatus]
MEVKTCHILLLVVTCAALSHVRGSRIVSAFEGLYERFDIGHRRVQQLKKIVTDLSRQVMLQQFMLEEKTRTDGSSGIKLIRGGFKGLDNYDSNSHTGNYFMAIHDHSNYDRTIGMGEISAVLNGLEFRTRHNDYKLVMPSTTSEEIDAVEDIPYPDVPPEVTSKPSVQAQVVEMQEWFKAFWTQNTTHRNYPKYFRPIVTYLEGAWTLNKNMKESFASDRHSLDASSWFELQEKGRFSAYSGVKESLENLAILPTTIMDVDKSSGRPSYAQWNYRVLGYPIEGDIPLKYLQHADDLASRISRGQTRPEMLEKRSARYKLYRGTEPMKYSLLDELMYTIPGKDNRYKNLSQAMFGEDGMFDFAYPNKNIRLDTGRYHRWYKSAQRDAMGGNNVARSYNDDFCFVAQTTQPSIASMEMTHCKKNTCETKTNRFSYAIPLEIIFLTPLLKWNPYKLKIHQGLDIVNANGRDGSDSNSLAYDGVDSNHYYLTPTEFFSGTFVEGDPADTVRNSVFVRGPDGKRYKTSASGTQIILQSIPGLGRVRCRYPIAPVHGEGSSVWRELNALRDMLNGMVREPPEMVTFEMSSNGDHTHQFNVTYRDFLRLINDRLPLTVVTEEVNGHDHVLEFRFIRINERFQYVSCDGADRCPDGHPRIITMLTNNVFTELPRPNKS